MAAYEEQLRAAQEDWEDFTTGKRRKFTTGTAATQQAKHTGDPKDIGAGGQQDGVDANGKPVWKGSGNVVNYVPAWERNFQKSMQQKQARLNSQLQ